ncbi:hypothetical protein [Streptomyces albogriseolus]|uniref:hypothetical protein n=1 Tax=Streptomyces albogriseolus TaxID=1887 RepID=UPI003D7470D9
MDAPFERGRAWDLTGAPIAAIGVTALILGDVQGPEVDRTFAATVTALPVPGP